MNVHELQLLITAKDVAAGALHALIGIIGSELVSALGEAANAAAQDEASMARLAQAFTNAGRTGADLEEAEAAIAAESEHMGFTHEALQDSLAGLITITHNTSKALDLLALSEDVARAKNLDLDTATKIVERTFDGNAKAAERYGFAIRDGSTATQALAQIQRQAAGQAEAYAETSAAGIDRNKNALAEWKEAVGSALGPAGQFLAILPGISAGMELVSGALAVLIPRFFGTAAAETAAAAAAVPTQLAFGGLAVAEDTAAASAVALDIALAPLLALFAAIAGTGLLVGIEGASIATGQGLVNPLDYLPHFAGGGVVPGVIGSPQLVVAEGGEQFLGAPGRSSGNGRGGGDLHIHVDGPIYSMGDFEQKVGAAVLNIKQRGGFRGVLA